MTDWREERYSARYSTDDFFKEIIDSSLPNEEIPSIPEFMVDFYEESSFSEGWMNTPDHVKKFILDAEIAQYMQK